MDLSPRETARSDILSSGLSNTTQRNALALLGRAHDYNGHITLTWPSLCDMWGLTSDGVARRYLGRISQAGIIHYTTNEWVYVTFRAWPPDENGAWELPKRRVGTTETARGNYPPDFEDDPDRRVGTTETARGNYPRRVGTTETARGDYQKNAYKELSECVSSLTLPSEKNSLNHSVPEDEQKRSAAILTDPAIGLMNRDVLAELVTLRPFEEIRAFCCDLFAENREAGTYAGLVATRIRTAASVPALRHNELWRRHMTRDEIAAEEIERAAAIAMEKGWAAQAAAKESARTEEPTADRRPPTADHTAGDIWPQVLEELAATMPSSTFDTWLRGTNLAGVEDGVYTVHVPHAHARDWLANRLAPQIQRTLSRIAQQAVDVVFAVRPRTQQEGITHA